VLRSLAVDGINLRFLSLPRPPPPVRLYAELESLKGKRVAESP